MKLISVSFSFFRFVSFYSFFVMFGSRHSKSNPIELNFNRTQSNSIELNSWIEFDWVRQSNQIELTEKENIQSNSIERSIFELLIFVKPALKIYNQILEDRVTWSLARGFLKRRNSAEMASDALWVVRWIWENHVYCWKDIFHNHPAAVCRCLCRS